MKINFLKSLINIELIKGEYGGRVHRKGERAIEAGVVLCGTGSDNHRNHRTQTHRKDIPSAQIRRRKTLPLLHLLQGRRHRGQSPRDETRPVRVRKEGPSAFREPLGRPGHRPGGLQGGEDPGDTRRISFPSRILRSGGFDDAEVSGCRPQRNRYHGGGMRILHRDDGEAHLRPEGTPLQQVPEQHQTRPTDSGRMHAVPSGHGALGSGKDLYDGRRGPLLSPDNERIHL